MQANSKKQLAFWLCIVLLVVFIQVIIGGITRLTESGLSITRWDVVTGSLPPLSESAWQSAFELYQQSPQYTKINSGMSLSEFKFIYFWEWLHRLWGRVGFMLLAGIFGYMAIRDRLDKWSYRRFGVLLVLYALQGLLGWVMVKSGLVDMPRVSHYRLTAHLLLALFLFAYLLWWVADLLIPAERKIRHLGLSRALIGLIGLCVVQITFGGFMSGLRAAIHFASWPDMNGSWIPDTLFTYTPWPVNFFENIATIQFTHRSIAYLLTILILCFWAKARRYPTRNTIFTLALNFLPLILITQVVLGITVLLLSYGGKIPVFYGVMHQAGGLLLLNTLLFLLFNFGKATR